MTTPNSDEADLSPEARRKAVDALVEYIGRRWVVCDHAQIIDPGGAVDAVVAALDRHDADEVKQLRAERARAESALTDQGRAVVDSTGDLEDGINVGLLAKNAEIEQLRAEVEQLRARLRLAPGGGPCEPDQTSALVALPPSAAGFLATLVGGTGDFVWGDIAAHFGLTADHVRDLFNILTAAARGIEGAGRD